MLKSDNICHCFYNISDYKKTKIENSKLSERKTRISHSFLGIVQRVGRGLGNCAEGG